MNAPARAKRKNLHFDESSLTSDWTELLENLRHEKMNLATWLSHARPIQRDGATLVLRFEAGQEQSRTIVERADNREIVVSLLRELSNTVQDIRCEVAAADIADQATEATLPIREGIDPEAAKRALDNPLIHSVVETFRGQIVDIRPNRNEHPS